MCCSICREEGHNKRTCKAMTAPFQAPKIEINIECVSNNQIKLKINFVHEKRRANVDNNGMELLVALLLIYPYIMDNTKVYEKINKIVNRNNENNTYFKLKYNNIEDIKKYERDLFKKKKAINGYIKTFREKMLNEDLYSDNIKRVYITGKHHDFSIINTLNDSIDRKSAKADLYIELGNETIIGLSVKQMSNAALTGYSVEKIIGEILNKEVSNSLKESRQNVLREHGITCFNKTKRSRANSLLFNTSNIYINSIKNYLLELKNKIILIFVNHLYSLDVPYEIYEFDGSSFFRLNINKIDFFNCDFEEHLPYYKKVSGEERDATKLFYRLVVNDKVYRVEIRHKGNYWNGSPQFLAHKH